MSELALLPAFTSAGLAAIAAAHGQGLSLKITHLAFGDTAYDVRDGNGVPLAAARARVALENERVRVAVAAGNAVTANSILVVGEVPAAAPEFWIKEVGFFGEDGTLVAVWSAADQSLGWRGANAPWLFKFVLSWSDLPPNAITVVFDGDAALSALATDMARIDAKVHHTVVTGGIAWDDMEETQLTEAIIGLITANATSPVDATMAVKGIVRLATLLETAAGLADSIAVTPAGLSDQLNGYAVLAGINSFDGGQRGQVVPVAYAGTVTLDMTVGNHFAIADLTGNILLDNPVNLAPGQGGYIHLRQDGAGGHAIAYGNQWYCPDGPQSLSSAAGAMDTIVYYVKAGDRVIYSLLAGV